jgi:hypothetical protein
MSMQKEIDARVELTEDIEAESGGDYTTLTTLTTGTVVGHPSTRTLLVRFGPRDSAHGLQVEVLNAQVRPVTLKWFNVELYWTTDEDDDVWVPSQTIKVRGEDLNEALDKANQVQERLKPAGAGTAHLDFDRRFWDSRSFS